MAWCRPGDKPLSEPMMVSLPTHICLARTQWVKYCIYPIRHATLVAITGTILSRCPIFVQLQLIWKSGTRNRRVSDSSNEYRNLTSWQGAMQVAPDNDRHTMCSIPGISIYSYIEILAYTFKNGTAKANDQQWQKCRQCALNVTGDVEGKLQRPRWRPGQSPWRPFRFCEAHFTVSWFRVDLYFDTLHF